MKKWIITLITIVLLVAAGLLAYRHFLLNQTLDKGGMENPNVIASEDLNGPGAVNGPATLFGWEAELGKV